MKEKIVYFIKDKKEFLVFLGILTLTLVTVIVIAQFGLNNSPDSKDKDDDTTVVNPDGDDTDADTDSDTDQPDLVYKFVLPYSGDEYVVVRDYFDLENPDTMTNAVIETSSGMIESKGVSYAKKDNTSFDVLAVYPGTVTEVTEDEVYGSRVTIDHGNNVVSVYYSLSETSLNKGDKVEADTVIGVAGTSLPDTKAGVHVHIEVILTENDKMNYINLTDLVGKTIDEVASSMK